MPFIGQDWRSPGEVWIKTEEGWERMKLLHNSHLIRTTNTTTSLKSEAPASGQKVPGHPAVSIDGDPSSKSVATKSVSLEVTRNSSGSIASLSSTATSLSSSPTSSVDNDSSLDSDSDGELIQANSVAIAAASSDEEYPATTSGSIPIFEDDDIDVGIEDVERSEQDRIPSMADIIKRLQKSSSQPIPIEILQESSILIESHQFQPYCRITLNPTREVAGSNIISDAFLKLDFCNAIRDIRRFSYVTKLLHLLITQNLTTLSGNATKALFWMLEEIAKQVATKKQNIHVIRDLLVELRQIVKMNLCWGRPLGSTSLWDQHLRTMERICEMTDNIEIKPPEDSTKPQWSELPEELIREIMLRLSDYKDLERSSEACERMQSLLTEEQHIWRQLCKYHFSSDQRKWAFERAAAIGAPGTTGKNSIYTDSEPDANGNLTVNWERTFHLLRKKFGLKEEYADCLFLCRYCRCLFWKSKGHPCILENPDLTRQQLSSTVTSGSESHSASSSSSSSSKNSTSSRSSHPPKKSSPPTSLLSTSAPPRAAAILDELQAVAGAASGGGSNSGNGNRHRHLSNPAGPSAPVQAVGPAVAALRQIQLPHQNHQLRRFQPPLQLPIVVQNFPFFEHPLVLQQQRRSNNNVDNNDAAEPGPAAAAAAPVVSPPVGDNPNNNNNNNAPAPPVDQEEQRNSFKKAPLHVPITPGEFLKFFSL